MLREVANALQCVGNHGIEVHRSDLAIARVSAEEEYLVPENRATHGRAKAIPMQRRLARLQVAGCVEVGFLVEEEDRSVDRVGTRLSQHRNDPCAGSSV